MSAAFDNLAFYHFVPIDDPEQTRDHVEALARKHDLLGTVILAHEGINGMLAGHPDACTAFEAELREDERLTDIWIKHSRSEACAFTRLKVKVKAEIVTMRQGTVPDQPAPELAPETFRDWLRNGEDMVVIDTRNDFEFRFGTFRGSVNPDTTAFHEFPDFIEARKDALKDQKVVMFCTGGIRCAKATRWMSTLGLGEVYQLEGGVLNYFESIEDAEKDWDGELFVFDERVGLNTNLEPTDAGLCDTCGKPHSGGVGALCDHVDTTSSQAS